MTKKELEEENERLRVMYRNLDNDNRDRAKAGYSNGQSNLREDNYVIPKFRLDFDNGIHIATFFILSAFIIVSTLVGIANARPDYEYDYHMNKVYGTKSDCTKPPQFIFTKYNPAYRLGCLIGKPLKE